jgi:hypothetical protein
MSSSKRLVLLRQILAVKVAFTILVWGLPSLLAPIALLHILGVPAPDDPLFVRLFGAVVTSFGAAYWYAYKDPVKNVAIVKAGVLDNALVTLTILVFTLVYDLRSIFMWISALLVFVFFLSFVILMPRTEAA